MRVHVNEFCKGGEFASCGCSKCGVFIVKVNDDDSCIGGFVVEYGAFSANECITIPDCLGELIHGYAIAKVEAGEHSGFHFFDVIVVYWGFSIMSVKSFAVSYEETLFEVACDGGEWVGELGKRDRLMVLSVSEGFVAMVLSVVDMNCWCGILGEAVD
jgi:hypothetical protein